MSRPFHLPYRLGCLFGLLPLLLPLLLPAQITLTTDYFPRVSDTLATAQATDEYLTGIQIQNPGAAVNWDFGYPDTAFTITEVLEAVSDDTLFTTAEARLTSPAFDFEYFRATDTAYQLVGLVGSLAIFPDLTLRQLIDPPRTVRRAGITYGDRFVSTSERRITLDVDSLPPAILTSALGGLLSAYDSARVISTSRRTDVVDAYGRLRLEDQEYDVLREKRTEQLENRLFLIQGDVELDVTSLAIQVDTTLAAYLGPQPPEGTYFFWSPTSLEPIVEIEFDSLERPTTFLYKRGGRGDLVSTTDPTTRFPDWTVFPNPATDRVNLRFPPGAALPLRIDLYRADGRIVRSTGGAGTQVRAFTTDGLPPGAYRLFVTFPGGRSSRQLLVR